MEQSREYWWKDVILTEGLLEYRFYRLFHWATMPDLEVLEVSLDHKGLKEPFVGWSWGGEGHRDISSSREYVCIFSIRNA